MFFIFEYEEIFLVQHQGKKGVTKEYVSISCAAIEKGLLSALPANVFIVYILLFSGIDESNKGEIMFSEILDKTGLKQEETEAALNLLEKIGILVYKKNEDYMGYMLNPISLDIVQESDTLQDIDTLEQEERFLRELLSGRPVSEQELVKGLVLILAPKTLTPSLRSEIEEIMNTFQAEMVKELIRRIKKAADENPGLKPLPYLRAIIKDWVEADLSTYEDLQRADRLYRETFELAQAFGLNDPKGLAPSHRETLLSWITQKDNDDFALSLDIAKLAIEEAIRRKRDGRPSLDYVERNYIIPWKKAKITSPSEVQNLFQGKTTSKKETTKKDAKKDWRYKKFLDT